LGDLDILVRGRRGLRRRRWRRYHLGKQGFAPV